MKKIFCFVNGGFGRMGGEVAAVAEDGEHLASHFSSNEGWAKHDIGINSDWKHDKYKAKYPDGYELVWLSPEETDTNVNFLRAIELNTEQGKVNNKS